MRRFEYTEGTSAKFWAIAVDGATVTTRWGRIGTDGRVTTKEHGSAAKADADAAKQIGKKTAKGYVEVGGDAPAGVATAAHETVAAECVGPDLADGQEHAYRSASGRTYVLKNTGGVYSCTCPAWRHQSIPIEGRTCKHLRAFRGDAAEAARIGSLPEASRQSRAAKEGAPAVLLAQSWDERDPTGWWMSEKLDGVRAWWDGSTFLSRQGNRFLAPDWFVASLPDHPLDGELFAGRGGFQDTVSIARRADRSDRWRELAYVVFDAPAHEGGFEERLAYAEGLALGPHARVLPHTACTGADHLRAELARIEGLGGEGLMLRRPGSRYVAGRSEVLLKVKTFHDAEATVVAHLAGTGKHKGRLGALQVALADGTRFKVGTGFSDAERADPPPVGAVITFRYQELTRAGVPRFPSFLRVRPDE